MAMTCKRHGGNDGSIFCKFCDAEVIEQNDAKPAPAAKALAPVAYVMQSLRDGSISDRIAPTAWLTFEQEKAQLESDPWIVHGAAKLAPLYSHETLLSLQAEVAELRKELATRLHASSAKELFDLRAEVARLTQERDAYLAELRGPVKVGAVQELGKALTRILDSDAWNSIEPLLNSAQAERDRLAGEVAALKTALKDANDTCRSAYQIASRGGKETDFETWKFALQKSLKNQHRIMFPEQYLREGR
jgi:hypothetical protein